MSPRERLPTEAHENNVYSTTNLRWLHFHGNYPSSFQENHDLKFRKQHSTRNIHYKRKRRR